MNFSDTCPIRGDVFERVVTLGAVAGDDHHRAAVRAVERLVDHSLGEARAVVRPVVPPETVIDDDWPNRANRLRVTENVVCSRGDRAIQTVRLDDHQIRVFGDADVDVRPAAMAGLLTVAGDAGHVGTVSVGVLVAERLVGDARAVLMSAAENSTPLPKPCECSEPCGVSVMSQIERMRLVPSGLSEGVVEDVDPGADDADDHARAGEEGLPDQTHRHAISGTLSFSRCFRAAWTKRTLSRAATASRSARSIDPETALPEDQLTARPSRTIASRSPCELDGDVDPLAPDHGRGSSRHAKLRAGRLRSGPRFEELQSQSCVEHGHGTARVVPDVDPRHLINATPRVQYVRNLAH